MKYQGFSPEEISKLIILENGEKYLDVRQDLQRTNHQGKFDRVYVLDDSKEDCQAMTRAVKEFGYVENTNLFSVHLNPTQFSWGSNVASFLLSLQPRARGLKYTLMMQQLQLSALLLPLHKK
jgi:hypothetical protein